VRASGVPALVGRPAILQSYRDIFGNPNQERIEPHNTMAIVSGDEGRVICIELIGGTVNVLAAGSFGFRERGDSLEPLAGGTMLGFIRQYADGVFEPEAVRILTGAFDDAWARLQASGAPFSQEEYALAARTIIAKRIIALGKEGQLDRHLLTSAALIHLGQQKMSKKPLNDLP